MSRFAVSTLQREILAPHITHVAGNTGIVPYATKRLLQKSLLLHAQLQQKLKNDEVGSSAEANASNMELEFRIGRAAARGVRGAPERLYVPVETDTILTENSHKFVSGAQKRSKEEVLGKCNALVEACSSSQESTSSLCTTSKSIVVSMPDDSRLEYEVTSPTEPSPLSTFGTKKRVDQVCVFRPHHATDVRISLSEEKDLRPEYSHIPKTPPAGVGQLSVVRIRERTTFRVPDLWLKVDVSDVSFLLDKHKFSPCATMTLSDLPAIGKQVFDIEIEVDLASLAEKLGCALHNNEHGDALVMDEGAQAGGLEYVESVLALADHLAPAVPLKK